MEEEPVVVVLLTTWNIEFFLVCNFVYSGGGDSSATRFGASNDVCSPAHCIGSGSTGSKLETCSSTFASHE